MSNEVLLGFVAVVLALVLVLLLLSLFHGSWVEYRRRRRKPTIVRTRAVLVDTLLGRSVDPAAAAELEGVPTRLLIEVLLELSHWLRPTAPDGIETVARRLGLDQRARALVYSHRWPRRLAGARLLTLLGGGEALLPGLVIDRHPLVRAQAAEWISIHPSESAMELAVRLLDDPDGLVRHTATDGLIRIGLDAAPALAQLLYSGEAVEAGLVVAAGVRHPVLVDPACRFASDPDPGRRRLAVTALGALGGQRAIAVLEQRTTDDDGAVRAAAARGLGRLRHWPAALLLAHVLADPDWRVRREAGLALRRLGAVGIIVLRRSLEAEDRFAADMARLVLEMRELDDELDVAA